MGSLDKQPPPAEETSTQPNEEGARLFADSSHPRVPYDLISSASGGVTFQTPGRESAETPGAKPTGAAAEMLNGFGLKTAAPEAATVANADRTPYNPPQRYPVSGPLTDALNKFYGTTKSTDANDLPAALTNSKHTPDELRQIFQHQPKLGWPALEGTGNTLNVYDRENRQYNFSYDGQSKTYKLNDTRERGANNYQAPERLRNHDADAFSFAAKSAIDRASPTVNTDVARFLNLASDRGVPLTDMVESLNRQLKSRSDGTNAAQLSGRPGAQSINIHSGQADITVDVRQSNGKWTINSRP